MSVTVKKKKAKSVISIKTAKSPKEKRQEARAADPRKAQVLAEKENVTYIGPQAGPQTSFLASTADIVIYGGAAGGGKSFGILLDPLRHLETSPDFGAVIFRKTNVQIRIEGGLWDESAKLYPLFGAKPRENVLEWRFPHPTRAGTWGMSVSFANLERDADVYNYQGAQIAYIGFDELTHFSENQFFYMLSRNRSTSGVVPRIRATCNPDPNSWVKAFILWWLDSDGQYADPAKSGVIRWFVRIGDNIYWEDSKEAIHARFGNSDDIQPLSVTFIPSKLDDNQILVKTDKKYKANLLAMNRVDRERLLKGDWKIRPSAGNVFKREWFPVVDFIPEGWIRCVRYWDRAATKPSESNPDPDWTRGLKLFKYPNGKVLVAELASMRDTPGQVENLIKNVASHDGYSVTVKSQQDPGSAGVAEAANFVSMLSGYDVKTETVNKDKVTRAKPVSAQAEWGNVLILRADWNEEFFFETENFSDDPSEYAHDDIVDVLSGAFNELSGGLSTADVL